MPESWVSTRQAVLSAVFIANLINFCIQWISRKTQDEEIVNRIRHCRIYVFVFGLISLFSCNLLQGGIYEALISWVVVGGISALHYVNFKDFNQKNRALVRLIVTFLLFGQSIGTIVNYLA